MIKSKKYVDASKLYDKTAAYEATEAVALVKKMACLLYTSPSPRDRG